MEFNTAYGYQDAPQGNAHTHPDQDPRYIYSVRSSTALTYEIMPHPGPTSSIPDGTGLDELMEQRRTLIDARIQMILSEITKRQALKQRNLYQIDVDQCAFRNLIFEIGDIYFSRSRVEFERRIIDLEQDKRKEESFCIRDILFLNRDLREAMIERLEEEQKTYLFCGTGEV